MPLPPEAEVRPEYANTGTLLAYSGHASVANLAIYTRVSPDALGR